MQNEWLYKVDEFGFHTGQVLASVVAQDLKEGPGFVLVAPPTDKPAWRQRWCWDGQAWVQRDDNRGHYWYDPSDTKQRWTAQTHDQEPPAGWLYLPPGTGNPTPRTAQLVQEARVQAQIAINAARDGKLVAPIEYDGGLFDADQRAQENLKAKIEEMRALEALLLDPPPEMLFWIDHVNSVRTFPNANAYRHWLAGLVITISSRGSNAYLDANRKKVALASATSVEQVWAIANAD